MTAPPAPRANPGLAGHDDAARTLAEAAESGRLHHAWLIAGPPGVGKATLAYRFARWLLAGLPPPVAGQPPLHLPDSHPTFRRVASGAHADLFTMAPNTGERGKKEILRADDARAALRFMAMTAAEGGWRAVIVEDLERADNVAVQNILLKTLEEPPPRTVQLLVTRAPDRLLPTIRSRCRRLDLAPLPDAAMERLLRDWLPDLTGPQRVDLIAIADGSPGRALELSGGEGLALQALVERVLDELPAPDPRRIQVIAEEVAGRRDAQSLGVFFALLRRALAAGLRLAGRGGAAPAWLGARSLAEWSEQLTRIGRLAEETERLNLDRKQAVLTGLAWLAARQG